MAAHHHQFTLLCAGADRGTLTKCEQLWFCQDIKTSLFIVSIELSMKENQRLVSTKLC